MPVCSLLSRRAPFGVRWCRECNTWHNTREVGEVWAHWSPGLGGVRMLGRVRLLLAPSPNSPIFDITDIFKCGVSFGRICTVALLMMCVVRCSSVCGRVLCKRLSGH
jgi:hypothetical protein